MSLESWHNSGNDDRAMQHVAALIAEVQPESMVNRFVLLVETSDGEDRWMSSFTAPDQKAWDSLGLLDFAITLERSAHVASTQDDQGDTP